MKPVILIDTYAQIYRSFYAIRSLTTNDGRPINALFGMAKFLLKIRSEFTDYDGAFVADLGKPFRLELAPDYKANRPPTPDALKAQLPAIFELIKAFGWQVLEYETWEADDLISALTINFTDRTFQIMSADKDLAQLINERVTMLIPSHDGKGFELRNSDKVLDKFGVPPEQILDYLALIGDNADNIPGINGVGPKSAAKLLQQYKSIDGILAHADEINGKALKENIVSGRERLSVNRQLVGLRRTLPDCFPKTDVVFTRTEPDWQAILKIASEHHLTSIAKEVVKLSGLPMPSECHAPAEKKAAPKGDDELDLFSLMQEQPVPVAKTEKETEQAEKDLFQPELF